MSANKVLLQELNQLIGIKMLTSDFLKIAVSIDSTSRGGPNAHFAPPVDAH